MIVVDVVLVMAVARYSGGDSILPTVVVVVALAVVRVVVDDRH